MPPKLTMDSLIKIIQPCDGATMDLDECARSFDVSPESLEAFIAEQHNPYVFVCTYDNGDKCVMLDGE